MNSSATAAVASGYNIEVPQKVKEGQFFVFFAADQIAGDVKATNPAWSAGGALRPKAITLRHRGGFVRKCEITQLLPQMISTAASNIHPSERKHLHPTYRLTLNGQVKDIGITREGGHDGLLRTEWHPADEVGRLTGRNDGFVRMPVNNPGEALRAQYFLFPDWDQVMNGTVLLSRRVSDLMEHFQSRRVAATDEFERAVAEAAIKSCTDYIAWAQRTAMAASAQYERMKVQGFALPVGTDADLAFEQAGIQRPDNLIQQQGNQMDQLTKAVTMLVEDKLGASRPQTAIDPDKYAQFLAWEAAQANQAKVEETPVPATAPPAEEKPKPRVFGKGTLVSVNGRPATIKVGNEFGRGARVEWFDDKTDEVVPFESVQEIVEE